MSIQRGGRDGEGEGGKLTVFSVRIQADGEGEGEGGEKGRTGVWDSRDGLSEILWRLDRHSAGKEGSHTQSTTGQGYTGWGAAWLAAIYGKHPTHRAENKNKQNKIKSKQNEERWETHWRQKLKGIRVCPLVLGRGPVSTNLGQFSI